MSLIIAVDPGMSGAIAVLNSKGKCEHLSDLPVITDKSLAWIDGAAMRSLILEVVANRDAACIIERVSAMPGQGVSSMFKFGSVYGSVLSLMQAMSVPLHFVTPVVWKGHYGLGKDKKAALHKARLMFPDTELHLAKHNGRAEALLIGAWFLSNKGADR